MGILAQWDSKVLDLNSANGLDSGTQSHFEAPSNLYIKEVIVTCSKLALGQLIQIQVMDSVNNKIFKIYIYIKSLSL